MKIILLILLWSFTAGKTKGNCMNLEDIPADLIYTTGENLCEIEARITVTCVDKTHFKEANITLKSVNCKPQGSSPPMVTHTEMITQPTCECQVSGSVASIGLGAVVGLLVALLAVVTTGWMWTCWTMKRRARIITNSRDIGDQFFDLHSNPSYGGNQLTLQNHPLPIPTPTYETIPPVIDGIKLDLALAEPKEEGYDAGKNREESYQKLNRAQRDNTKRESTDQTHKSGQRGYQGKERVIEPSSGTALQEIQHNRASTSTRLLLDSAVPSEEGKSANSVDIGEMSQENETTDGSMKKNDNELDGTILGHDQTETSEKEQDMPKKRATPRDYELAVPSK